MVKYRAMRRSNIPFRIFSFTLLLMSLALLSASFAAAQSVPVTLSGLSLTLSANDPTPGQTVTVTAQSYVADIKAASMRWTVNDKILAQGTGIVSIQVIAPPLGKHLDIKADAVTVEGKSMTASANIGSGAIDIIVESEGYVPPLFMGKAPLAYQNTARIIAMPHLANASGQEYDPKTLVYQWKKDSQVLEDQSGYGRQSIEIAGGVIPRTYTLDLTVWTKDNSAQARSLIDISVVAPSLAFYKNDPLYGPLYNSALSSSVGLGKNGEVSVIAAPFGFDMPTNGLGDLSFSWLVNGVEDATLAASRSIVLRAPGDAGGASDIELDVENSADILQGAKGGFTAIFAAKAPTTNTTFNGN